MSCRQANVMSLNHIPYRDSKLTMSVLCMHLHFHPRNLKIAVSLPSYALVILPTTHTPCPLAALLISHRARPFEYDPSKRLTCTFATRPHLGSLNHQSHLFRLLKDSLGGNCKTLMVACVSPAKVHMVTVGNF